MLGVKETSKVVSYGQTRIRELCKCNKIPNIKYGRAYRIPKDAERLEDNSSLTNQSPECLNMDFTFLDKLDVNAYVVDENLNLLHINKKAAQKYKNIKELVGKNILECHKKESSKEKITTMLNEFSKGRREPFNYSLKKGAKVQYKVIIPIYEANTFKGMIEFSYFANGG